MMKASVAVAVVATLLVICALIDITETTVHHGDGSHGGDYDEPIPYNFGYDIEDESSRQYRQESGDGKGRVSGSYGFSDDRGIRRDVKYTADESGFRARVETNEPGTESKNPASVEFISTYNGGSPGNGKNGGNGGNDGGSWRGNGHRGGDGKGDWSGSGGDGNGPINSGGTKWVGGVGTGGGPSTGTDGSGRNGPSTGGDGGKGKKIW